MSGKDIATIEERTRDRIREVFAGLLSDEELDTLIKKAYDKFFNEPSERVIIDRTVREEGGNFTGKPQRKVLETTGVKASPFEVICFDFFAREVHKHISGIFESEDFNISHQSEFVTDEHGQNGMYVPTINLGKELEERCEKLAKEKSHIFFESIFAGFMSTARVDMINQITNNLHGGNNQW